MAAAGSTTELLAGLTTHNEPTAERQVTPDNDMTDANEQSQAEAARHTPMANAADAIAQLVQQLATTQIAGRLDTSVLGQLCARLASGLDIASDRPTSSSSDSHSKAKAPDQWEGDEKSESYKDWLYRVVLYLVGSNLDKSRWVITTCSFLGPAPMAHAKQLITDTMLASGEVYAALGFRPNILSY